mgnify:CR=1 FL=1
MIPKILGIKYYSLFDFIFGIFKIKSYFCTPSKGKGSDGRVARQRSAKPPTAVRIRFRPRLKRKNKILNTMGVTRLKRKDRRNKTVSRVEVQFLKLGRNIELGSRSEMPKKSQIVKNDEILNKLAAEAK